MTHMFAPPSMVQMLTAETATRDRDLGALECLLVGGAPITDATALAGRAAFGDVLYQVFGQTEAVPLTVMTPQEWFSDVPGSTHRCAPRERSCRSPASRCATRTARCCPWGAEGELFAQVESQMSGFWNDDELTSVPVWSTGGCAPGTSGASTTNGYVYILDRADDMIVSGAASTSGRPSWSRPSPITPRSIEVAVFAVPHDLWGETPMAVCRVDPGGVGDRRPRSMDLVRRDGWAPTRSRAQWSFTHEPLPKNVVGRAAAQDPARAVLGRPQATTGRRCVTDDPGMPSVPGRTVGSHDDPDDRTSRDAPCRTGPTVPDRYRSIPVTLDGFRTTTVPWALEEQHLDVAAHGARRSAAREVAPGAARAPASRGRFDADLARAAGRLGAYGLLAPERFGGGGADLRTLCLTVGGARPRRLLARGDRARPGDQRRPARPPGGRPGGPCWHEVLPGRLHGRDVRVLRAHRALAEAPTPATSPPTAPPRRRRLGDQRGEAVHHQLGHARSHRYVILFAASGDATDAGPGDTGRGDGSEPAAGLGLPRAARRARRHRRRVLPETGVARLGHPPRSSSTRSASRPTPCWGSRAGATGRRSPSSPGLASRSRP